MEGDLSLSQSLGGLRIANPDESTMSSPLSSPDLTTQVHSLSSQSSNSTVTEQRRDVLPPILTYDTTTQHSEGLGFNPDTYNLQNTILSPTSPVDASLSSHTRDAFPQRRVSQRQSLSAYQAAEYATNMQMSSQPPISNRKPIATHPADMYMQSNTSASSQGSQRFRDDVNSSDGSIGGLGRNGSRSTRGMVAGVPEREHSRSHRHAAQNTNGLNPTGLPTQRSAGRPRAPTSGSGYESTGSQYSARTMPKTAEEWQEQGAAVMTRQEIDASGKPQLRTVKKGVKDFNFGRTLGEGSYSTVLAATDRQNLKEYAIKVLDKRHIIKEKKVKYVNIERDTLNRLTEHPGIVRLYYTFQDERSLYFVLDLASGGELLGVLKKMGSFDVECTRFYGAQILDSIAYMHTRGVIHRDLKPENVLLDSDMFVKITDFGTAKILPNPKPNGADDPGNPTDGAADDRAMSFVGTAEYVSPELLRDKNACKASDLWAFGCIIFQLLAGRPPFKAANEYLTFQKILALEYTFPPGFPELARDLVERLLVLEPANRLPVEQIMSHRFFEGIKWGKDLWRHKAPRLKKHVPLQTEPKLIRLNGVSQSGPHGPAASAASAAAAAMAGAPIPSHASPPQQYSSSRPQLRGVTDLPPPSQLDIDWSPVLTRNNERILKLGNLIVSSGPQSSSPTSRSGEPGTPSEKPKFSRFFTPSTTKKRERLVLITSSARLIIAPAGGNEKKAKMDVDFLSSGTSWKSFVDSKGLTAWSMDTRDKHLVFEDPRATTSDPAGSKYSTQEWLDSLDQARELALSMKSVASSYSDNSLYNNGSNMGSAISSPIDSNGGDGNGGSVNADYQRHNLRQTLRRPDEGSNDGFKGRKRFSKRHSKSGLAAVF